ncbi:hypothetical protein GALL_520530 [mine drainage metagenome]|uniref:Uncharacterized protein n=1 Tax=mine drainage metagenome TaxID=410659 RepID=A0A1J5P496_9ZZZZ
MAGADECFRLRGSVFYFVFCLSNRCAPFSQRLGRHGSTGWQPSRGTIAKEAPYADKKGDIADPRRLKRFR